MKKSYSKLDINEKINLKHNHDLGETHIDRNYNKLCKWKGNGALLFLRRDNKTFNCKNFNVEVSGFDMLVLVRNSNNKYIN
jgi:helix-turn-helix protein